MELWFTLPGGNQKRSIASQYLPLIGTGLATHNVSMLATDMLPDCHLTILFYSLLLTTVRIPMSFIDILVLFFLFSLRRPRLTPVITATPNNNLIILFCAFPALSVSCCP